MSKIDMRVALTPKEALEKVLNRQTADLVHEEFHDLGAGRQMGTLVFEKYYFRAGNRAALVVIADNLQGVTEVRIVATGSGRGVFFKMDSGAATDFALSVEEILADDQV